MTFVPHFLRAAYVSPFRNPTNRINAIMAEDMRALGLSVSSLKKALLGDWRVPRSAKVIALNWFEDRLAYSPWPALEFVRSALVLIALKLRVKHVLWVRHNEAPHAGQSTPRLHRILLALLEWAAATTVTLRPSPLGRYVVPHPTYPSNGSPAVRPRERKHDYLLFGRVRPNKGYAELLRWWPAERRLVILGPCSDPMLARTLRALIAERGLMVEWRDRFIPDDELDVWLSESRYVLVMHGDGTSLVSGTFFHAASWGANVLVSPGEFLRYLGPRYSFVSALTPQNLDAQPALIASERVLTELEHANGRQSRLEAWSRVFLGIGTLIPAPRTSG